MPVPVAAMRCGIGEETGEGIRRSFVKRLAVVAVVIWSGVWVGEARAQKAPLLPEKDVAALANELSGETAKRNLEGIARFHRQRGSRGFHEAAELVAERLRAYGLSDVAILQFPADGKIFYGTQRSRPAWHAQAAELWETSATFSGCPEPKVKAGEDASEAAKKYDEWRDQYCSFRQGGHLLASYESEPVALAEDSESANLAADLVDVGEGTKESDYAGKDLKGKIVLVSAQPGAVQDLAVGKYGAAGIVSYAQNQKTAWWGEDENLIRWGHLETFSPNETFAFMVSLKTARQFRERLTSGEKITLHAAVKATRLPGYYEVVTATIPGGDPKLKDEEIAFSCHLDHQRPGANDNASGCVTILEVARTIQKLIDTKQLVRPARTLRFIFPPEIEGTLAFLNGTAFIENQSPDLSQRRPLPPMAQRPMRPFESKALASKIKAVIHMDMVGGGPETKAVFHVTRGPMSLPSFVHDVAWAFAEWVNEKSYQFAATGKAEYPLVAPEGGKEPLRAEYSAFTMGSDHDVYQDSSFGIPAIYLNDWPDRYIHTNFDTAANIDPTKLKRAAFIGAASGYFLAQMTDAEMPKDHLPNLISILSEHRLTSYEELLHRCLSLSAYECGEMTRPFVDLEVTKVDSIKRFAEVPPNWRQMEWSHAHALEMQLLSGRSLRTELLMGDFRNIRKRKVEPRGPLAVFGYDYFAEHAKAAGVATPKLLSYEGLWGSGEEYAYEVLNFADGKRNAQEICDAVSAEYGPVPVEMVAEYLRALEKIGVVEPAK
jgi:aminopeptidase YwaD